jgi:hypothetical protein
MVLFTALCALADARPPEPRVEAPSTPLTAADGLTLRIVANGAVGVVVDGCASIELDRRTEKGWERVAMPACDPTKPPVRVDDVLTVTLPPVSAGEYRAGVTWGARCPDKVPLIVAGCADLGAVWSEAFTIAPAPAPPAKP